MVRLDLSKRGNWYQPVETQEVEDAIDHLKDQYLPVVEIEYQGQTHYFKEP